QHNPLHFHDGFFVALITSKQVLSTCARNNQSGLAPRESTEEVRFLAEDKRGLVLAGLKICDSHATVVPVKAPQYGVRSDRKSRHASEVGDAAALRRSRRAP